MTAQPPLIAGVRFPQQSSEIAIEKVVFQSVTPLPATAEENTVVIFTDDGMLYQFKGGIWVLAGGGGAGDTYTNLLPTPVTIGGIPAGSTFIGKTMQEMWDALLYPYLNPAFTAFSLQGIATTMEVGDTIPASQTFLWSTSNPANIQPNSLALYDLTGSVTLDTGLANTGSRLVTMPAPITKLTAATHQFRITGLNTHAVLFAAISTYSWKWRGFWGANANPTVTEAQIEAMSSGFVTGLAGNYPTPAGGYKYFCIPHVLGGSVNTVRDPSTQFDIPMAMPVSNPAYSNFDGNFYYALVSVTNSFGVTTSYRVYRTYNASAGSVTLAVT